MATYSDRTRAETLAALDANGGNVAKTARDTGIPRQTIQEWRDGRVSADVPELRQEKKEALADRLEALAHTIVDALPGKIAAASAKDAATALGISVDKMQLLRAKPTSISAVAEMSEDECRSLLTELLGGTDTLPAAGEARPGPAIAAAAPPQAQAGPVN